MSKKKNSPPRREPTTTATPAAPSAAASPAPPQHGFVVFRETIESIVVAFVLAFLFRTFEAEAFVIPTGSMSPSLQGQHKDVDCPQCGYGFRTTASSEGEDRDRIVAELGQKKYDLRQLEAEMARVAATEGQGSLRLRQLEAQRSDQAADVNYNQRRVDGLDVVGGMCPMCRYLMPMRRDLPEDVRDDVNIEDVAGQPSYPGDRILVNKYGFDFGDPERWDVVVFKFPGDGNMNYIKRLVGLPGEELQVYLGDLFARPLDARNAPFKILRKPADKVEAMLEPVHDTGYEPAMLANAGWPLRWAATTPDGWKVDAQPGEQTVAQKFMVDLAPDAPEAWLRYRHLPPTADNWRLARALSSDEAYDALRAENPGEAATREEGRKKFQADAHPHLINDFNAYNARLLRSYAEQDGWEIVPHPTQGNSGSLGTEWVGDLAIDVEVNVEESRGELLLDLVEAGYHFRATIDLTTGKVALSIIDGRTGAPLDFKATGDTGITSAGQYSLRLANVDDQLLLWVDGDLIDCGDASYDPDVLFAGSGGRKGMIPWASEDEAGDQGDLSPVGVGARGAKLAVTRLQVLRDIYYIATKWPGDLNNVYDYEAPGMDFTLDGRRYPGLPDPQLLFMNREYWPRFATRQHREFDIKEGQLFVMGDNSPESKDCRLWKMGTELTGIPGGQYLDRRLLIGKALAVFWPHSWGEIPLPGLKKLPGWPNFGDMRFVK